MLPEKMQAKMSSREIAELTGKQHKHVFRDISKMLEDIGCPSDGLVQEWSHPQNKQNYKEFMLDKKLTECLLTGYSAKARYAVIERWHELEKKQPALPDFSDPVAAARAWADAEEQKQKAIAEVEAARPAVEFVGRYVESSSGSMNFREVAKILEIKENKLREFLAVNKIMYPRGKSWLPYASHIDAGRFELKTGTSNGHSYTHPRFTAKGVEWLAKVIERD